jgi:hypothetical protein
MGCTYGQSNVFSVVPTKDQNTGKLPSTPRTEILRLGHSDCQTSYTSLAQQISQDILQAFEREKTGFPMPTFIVLAHKWEWLHPDLALSQYIEKYVEIRDISLGYPLSSNYYLYLTDPAAFGFPIGVTDSDVLNSPLRNAVRITYIDKQEFE